MEPNLPPSNQESVSASEVEGLLAQIGGSNPSQPTTSGPNKKDTQPIVFRRWSSFSATELRKLSARHEEFIRSLTARLAGHLRLEIDLKMLPLETMPFGKWIDALSNPTYLALLKLEPLKGICLLEIPPQLGLSIVDRELGGPGECLDNHRALTEIESRILSRIVEIIFGEWCAAWNDVQELRPVLTWHEGNGGFVQNPPPDAVMLVLGVELQMGDLTKQIHFGFPYATLEPLVKKLHVEAEPAAKPTAKAVSVAPKWNPALDDINIKVTAELPGLKIATKELTKLKAGDVIPLDSEVFQHLRMSLAKKPKFVATVGRCGTRWAAKITKSLEPSSKG